MKTRRIVWILFMAAVLALTGCGGKSAAPAAEKAQGSGKTLKRASPRTRRMIICAAAVLAIALVPVFMQAGSRTGKYISDADNTKYRIEDYDAVTPREAGKAYLIINRGMEIQQGETANYLMYHFTMREDNGIALHIDRLEVVYFKRANAVHPFVFLR